MIDNTKILHDISTHEVFTVIDGNKAYVEYQLDDDKLDILHTVVPHPLEGQGIASALVKFAYDYALANNLKPAATCPYAKVWLQRHPEYVAGD